MKWWQLLAFLISSNKKSERHFIRETLQEIKKKLQFQKIHPKNIVGFKKKCDFSHFYGAYIAE